MKKLPPEVQLSVPDNNGQLVINKLQIRMLPNDRTPKDVAAIISAIQSAESPYYPNRSYLYDIYTQILMDPFLSGIIEKRVSAVLNKKICFEINGKEDDGMDSLLKSENFRQLLRQKMERKLWGIAGQEFIPGETFAFNPIPKKHIKPNLKIISKDEFGQEGLKYEGVWNLWVTGRWDDLGLLLQCAIPCILKRGVLSDYAQFIELFGQPIMIFLYDAFDQKTKVELDEVMRNMGSSPRLSMPKQAAVDIKDGKQSNANGDLQNKFIDICNREMAIKILGATETTQSSSSSGYAQSEEHGKQQDEIIKSDLVDIANELNSPHFFRILESYGYKPGNGHFYFKDEIDLEELSKKLTIAKTTAQIVPVSDDYFYELTGIPKPDNYDELIREKEEAKEMETKKAQADAPPGKEKEPNPADELKGLSFYKKLKALFYQAP